MHIITEYFFLALDSKMSCIAGCSVVALSSTDHQLKMPSQLDGMNFQKCAKYVLESEF